MPPLSEKRLGISWITARSLLSAVQKFSFRKSPPLIRILLVYVLVDNWYRSIIGSLRYSSSFTNLFVPAGNLVQRSAERVALVHVPLDVMCDVVRFFEHVKELECHYIQAPQQVCLCNVLLLTRTIQFASFQCIFPWREEHDCSFIYLQ